MTAGLSDDLQQIDAARKTAIIDAELHRLHIDIAALQETRLAYNRFLTKMHYTFFWQGKQLDDRREVGFAVRNSQWLNPQLAAKKESSLFDYQQAQGMST